LQPDGKVVIGGDFTTVNGVLRSQVARFFGTDLAPGLNIVQSKGSLTISWPLSATGFVLDHSLTTTGIWSQVNFPYATNANVIQVTVPAPTGTKFFRLRKP
jgi:hypothetical protein